jgi:hypothetical protein
VLDRKGQVSDENVQVIRKAGFSDADVAEIIAHVAINVKPLTPGVQPTVKSNVDAGILRSLTGSTSCRSGLPSTPLGDLGVVRKIAPLGQNWPGIHSVSRAIFLRSSNCRDASVD